MKKILLSIVFALISLVTAYAADLNPFAYGLSSTFDAAQKKLTVNYKLNATATNVKVVVYDNASYEYTVDCSTLGLSKGAYVKEITLPVDCPSGVSLSWRVEVTGSELNKPTKVTKEHYLYHPRSIDIDNNPENDNFGIVFVVEGLHDITGKNSDDAGSNSGLKKFGTYLSWGIGAGLYAFDASFDNLKIYGANGYGGGQSYTVKWQFPDWNGVNGTANAYSPNRVRVSKDGRIFISSCTPNSSVLWEVTDKDMFNSGTPKAWESVVSGTFDNANYCLNDAQGNYIAGPNMSLDVKGSGDDLTLLMLSGNIQAIDNQTVESFRLMEYNLGKNTKWNTAPKVDLIADHKSADDKKIIAYNVVQVCYDNEGGFWVCQDRAESKGYASLFHVNANNEVDLNETILNRGGGGIRFNSNFTKVIISGKHSSETISGISSKVTSGTLAWATVYSVSKQNTKPVLTKLYEIDMTCLGNRLPDFAWDYADNIYASSYSKETVTAWAMPRTDVTAVTPAASKYSFEKETQYGDPQLAPFAYDLRKTIEGDGRTKLHFMLNAHARRVVVWIKDKESDTKYTLRDYPTANSEYDFVPYNDDGYGTVITMEDVARLGLQYNKHYTWGVDVYGKNVAAPNCVQSYSFYHPSAVDIDNNPENPNFGMILTNECQHDVKTISGYMGTGYGAGIYAFTADFKPIKSSSGQYGFNGGNVFTTKRADNNSENAYAPRRLRISDDGRIFVTSLNTNGDVLWEVDAANLNQWNPVFQGLTQNANKDLVKGSTFVAGPNAGFDVRGSGPDLQLLMLSANTQTYGLAQKGFRISEYNLGNNTTWNTNPSKDFPPKDVNVKSYFIVGKQSQVQYDKDGGVWYIQYRSETTEGLPGLVYFDKDGNEKKKWLLHNIYNAGFRFNHDFTKVVIAGVESGAANSKKATIYAVSKDANGVPILEKELEIDMSVLGASLNDFAWDYAGNLYGCGNENGKLAAYVMPRKATDVVSTPAREEEMIYFECQPNTTFDVTVATSDAAQGTVEGGGNALPSCEPTTVLAKSNDGYKFVYWKEGDNIVSRDNPYTFDVTHNTQLTAYFEEGAYSVSYWNLFRNGEDIAKESTKFPNTNERLWRLLQNDYYAYCVENDTHGEGLASKLKDRGVIENVRVKFGTSGTVLSETTKLPYKHFVVASSLSNSSAHIDFKDYMLNENGYFNWMAQFIIRHYEDYVGNRTKVDPRNAKAADWLYYPWMIINRTDSVYSMTKQTDGTILSSLALNMVNGEYDTYGMEDSWEKEHMYINWTSFIQDSKPKGWRNWYTHIALGLDSTLSYNDPLPVTWNRYECKTFELKDESGNPLSSETYDDLDPSQWHQWTGEPWSYIIWRDGSIDGPVVEHVTRDNMKLYADFGELDIYEDRNNDRTISILERDKNHPTHPRATHSIRVHRPLQAGMYNTICLPFDLDLTNPNQPIKSALEFTGTTTTADGEMMFNFRQVTELQAGMPYLVEPKSEVGYDNVIYGDVVCPQDFEAISHTPEGSAVTFHAVMNPTRLDNYENVYLLVANNRLARSISAGDMLGMRGYFTVNGELPAKAVISFKEGVTTGTTSTVTPTTDGVQKVLQNQQILIIRDGEIYNILGEHINTK